MIIPSCHQISRSLGTLLKAAERNARLHYRGYAAESTPAKTVLYDFHISHGGKMVDFAGFLMPVQYGKVGIAESHKTVRSDAGIFDVSHMLQSKIHGKDRIKFMEKLCVADVQELAPNTGTLSLYTTPTGGIIDDLIVNKTDDNYLYVVSNAGRIKEDLAHMQENLAEFKAAGHDVELELIEDHGLIALQGPKAADYLKGLVLDFDLSSLYFMNTVEVEVAGIPCRVTRCGYTGEDGFEISVPKPRAAELAENLNCLGVHLAGLGARDSLRLEAGLCLYGNDIDESTTPIEAGLAWTIGKRRKKDADFTGADVILKQQKEKPSRRRVGLVSTGPPPRQHCAVLDDSGVAVGEVTSGVPAPSVGKNVAMGYVPAGMAKAGTQVNIQVRKKVVQATVTKMPFVKCNYYNPPKK